MLTKTAWNFASQVLSFGVSILDRFVLVAILLRVWSTDLYSDWTTISAYASLLGLCDLGFGIYIGNQLQKAFSKGDAQQFQRLLGFSVFIYGALAVILLVVLGTFGFFAYFEPFISVRSLGPSNTVLVFLLLGLVQIVYSAKSAVTQVFRARSQYARGSTIDSLSSLLITASAILGAVSGAGPVSMALIYMFAHVLVGWGLLVAGIRWNYPDLRLEPIVPRAFEFGHALEAMKWYAFNYMAPSIWLQMPVLLLSILGFGGTGLVVFVVHRTLVNAARMFPMMLSAAVSIELSSHMHVGNRSEVHRGISILGRMIAAFGGALVAGLLYFGAPTMALWTGKPDYFDAAILIWLMIPIVLVAPAIPFLSLAHFADLPKPLAISNLVQIGIAMPVCLMFGREYGASGTAFGLAAAETIAVGVLFPAMIARRLHFKYLHHALLCLVISAAAFSWAGLVALASGYMFGTVRPATLLFVVLPWGGLVLLPTGYFVLPVDQRARVLTYLRGIIATVRASLIHQE